jgi:transposase
MDIQVAKDTTSEEQAKLLMTMPRVDYYAAMILLSEIGDVHRSSSDEKLLSWVGLAPHVHDQERQHLEFSANACNPQDNATHACESSTNASSGGMDRRKLSSLSPGGCWR